MRNVYSLLPTPYSLLPDMLYLAFGLYLANHLIGLAAQTRRFHFGWLHHGPVLCCFCRRPSGDRDIPVLVLWTAVGVSTAAGLERLDEAIQQ